MNEKLSAAREQAARSAKALAKWLALSVIIGVVCGLAGAAFSAALSAVTAFRMTHTWLILLLPPAGLVIVWAYRTAGMQNDSGTNQIIAGVRGEGRPPVRLAPLIFLATLITHLFGGSAGREGAALQIGGALAAGVGRVFRLDERGINLTILCGMSGLFSALFGTPLTAAVFSLEVVSVGVMHYFALFPCLLTALTAYGVTALLHVPAEVFPALVAGPALAPASVLRVGVLGVLTALLSLLFCGLMHGASYLYRKYLPSQYLRILAGGLLVVLLTAVDGSGLYNGAGTRTIMTALEGGAVVPWAFLLKIVFTALTLGAGYRGGEIVPTLFVGASFGCAAAPLLGLDPWFAAAIAMAALFCAVVNCPLAAIFLAIELFGSQYLLFFALACALSYLLSGRSSLYSAQIFTESKTELRFLHDPQHH